MSESLHRFDVFELNWNTRQLFRKEEPVAIEPKSLELIRYLLLNRNRAVNKDELAEAVWPGRVISDSVISQTVRKARAAVGDDGERQQVIATVRGFGYRFVAQVQSPDRQPRTRSVPGWQGTRLRALGWMTACTMPLVLFLLIFLELRPASAPVRASIAITPFSIDGEAAAQWLDNGIGQMLTAALEHSRGGHVLPYSTVQSQLELARVPDEALEFLHTRLGADLIIGGRLAQSSEGWRLQVNLDHADGRRKSIGFEGEEPIRLTMAAQRWLLAEVGAPADTPPDFLPHFLPDQPWLNETYFRGLQARRDGEAELALRLFDTVLEFLPDHPWTRYQMAVALRQIGDLGKARVLLESLLADNTLREHDSRLWRVSVSSLGNHYWYEGDMDTALEYYGLMAEEGEAAGHALDHAIGLLNQGMVHSNRGDYRQAEQHYAEALAIYSSIGFLPGRARVATAMATLASRLGAPDSQESWNRQALEINRTLGNQRGVAEGLYGMAIAAATRMDMSGAVQYLEEARLVARGLRDAQREAKITSLLGLYRASSGQLSRGRVLVGEALEQAREIGYLSVEKDCLGFLGEIELLAGNPDQALPWLEKALAVSTPQAHPEEHLRIRLYRIEALLEAGETDQAAEELEQVEAEGWLEARPPRRVRWMMQRAWVAEITNQPETAQEWLQDALTLARNNELTGMVVATTVRLGRLHLKKGRNEAAQTILASLPAEGLADADVLDLHAELAWQTDRPELAIDYQRQARSAYGERWGSEQAARLERFLSAANEFID